MAKFNIKQGWTEQDEKWATTCELKRETPWVNEKKVKIAINERTNAFIEWKMEEDGQNNSKGEIPATRNTIMVTVAQCIWIEGQESTLFKARTRIMET